MFFGHGRAINVLGHRRTVNIFGYWKAINILGYGTSLLGGYLDLNLGNFEFGKLGLWEIWATWTLGNLSFG
jgi:hypothetical protein